jgi:hypothetical protein
VEDENLYELEIKNLDTNEVMKMKIPIDHDEHHSSSGNSSQHYESHRRKDVLEGGVTRLVRTFVKCFLTLGRCDWGERWEAALLSEEHGELEQRSEGITLIVLQHTES